MHCRESEVVTGFEVAHDLLCCRGQFVEVGTPSVGHIPSLGLNPLLSTLSGHYSVIGAGEEKCAVALRPETVVEVGGALHLLAVEYVVEVAGGPVLRDQLWQHVQLSLNHLTAEVVLDRLCPQAWHWLVLVALTIYVPGIGVSCVVKECEKDLFAGLAVVLRACHFDVGEITFVSASFIKFIINESVIESHLEEGREPVIFPVSQPVSYNLSLEVGHPCVGINLLSILAPLVDCVQQIWNHDATMLLTCDPQGIILYSTKLVPQKFYDRV